TQMIAKGHDFEAVNLVGIIDADVSLFTNDYRATETTFQLVTQVAGRAGRKGGQGQVFLQTYAPRHYVYRLARNYDYKSFYEHEVNVRQTTQFPPFSNIIRVLVTSEDDLLAKKTIKSIIEPLMSLKTEFGKQIYNLQAMPSPIKRIQNKFRYQIIIRYALNDDITCKIHTICDIMPKGKVSIFIENNPRNIR
ncbi:MAG: primosomal protein N', partial [Clostridia bacterium]|nr:primosomal protein N' [Clostridia bacterium]